MKTTTKSQKSRPNSKFGFLTAKQSQIIEMRSKGFTQEEVASTFSMSRASVSMLEARARRRVAMARETLEFYKQLTKNQYKITIPIGTRLEKIPVIVLMEADRKGIHIQSNMVTILRKVKKERSDNLSNGVSIKKIVFAFNERGRLSIL